MAPETSERLRRKQEKEFPLDAAGKRSRTVSPGLVENRGDVRPGSNEVAMAPLDLLTGIGFRLHYHENGIHKPAHGGGRAGLAKEWEVEDHVVEVTRLKVRYELKKLFKEE